MGAASRLTAWRHNFEPWYLVYVVLAIATAGIAPILLPLVIDEEGGATEVGIVMAINGLGGLTAAVWGSLADRYGLHQAICILGALAGALTFVGFAFFAGLAAWALFAATLGIGIAMAFTMSSLFVVEVAPKEEQDARIGVLQACITAGTVVGLVVAGLLSHLDPVPACLISAGVAGLAALLAVATTKTPSRPGGPAGLSIFRRHPDLSATAAAGPHLPGTTVSPHLHLHYPIVATFRRLLPLLRTPFGVLLAVWFLANLATGGIYALYPLLVKDLFGIPPSLSSIFLAVANAAGVFLFTPAGLLVHKIGGARVLQGALIGRLAGVLGLGALGLGAFAGREWLVLLAFTVLQLAWPLASVSSTVLTSQLAPGGQGEGLGTYTTVQSLGGLVGPLIGGFLGDSVGGYPLVVWSAAGFLAATLALSAFIRPPAVPARRGEDHAVKV